MFVKWIIVIACHRKLPAFFFFLYCISEHRIENGRLSLIVSGCSVYQVRDACAGQLRTEAEGGGREGNFKTDQKVSRSNSMFARSDLVFVTCPGVLKCHTVERTQPED